MPRGRPAKKAVEADVENVEPSPTKRRSGPVAKATLVEANAEPEVPKKRGRTAKASNLEEEAPKPSPLRRGRRSLQTQNADENETAGEKTAADEIANEKSGTPKGKKTPQKTAVDEAEEAENSGLEMLDLTGGSEKTPTRAKRSVEKPAEEVFASPNIPAKRSRGRPSKPKDTTETTEEMPESAVDAEKAKPGPKGKGKAKKGAAKVKAATGAVMSASAMKATAAVMSKAAAMAEPSSNAEIGKGLSSFERMQAIRQRNIQEKMDMLKSLGLMDARDKIKREKKKTERKAEIPDEIRRRARKPRDFTKLERRSSSRVVAKGRRSYVDMDDGEIERRAKKGEGADKEYDFSDSDSEDDADANYSALERAAIRKSLKKGGNADGVMVSDSSLYKYQRPDYKPAEFFGAVDGVPMGEIFISRMEASYALVHRPPVAGIAGGAAKGGAFSICLSGGGDYNEDLDFGYFFTFSGAGGRDLSGTKSAPKNLRCAPQSRDQELEGVNLALSMNVETGRPVRVIRGFRGEAKFAPKFGYRYDGLYEVKEWRYVRGSSGFKVITFALKRIEDQDPAPWEADDDDDDEEEEETDDVEKETSGTEAKEDEVEKEGDEVEEPVGEPKEEVEGKEKTDETPKAKKRGRRSKTSTMEKKAKETEEEKTEEKTEEKAEEKTDETTKVPEDDPAAEETTEKVAPKKRGRPAKGKKGGAKKDAESSADEETEEKTAVPKKRGRPAKAKKEEPIVEKKVEEAKPADEAGVETPSPKKRGRRTSKAKADKVAEPEAEEEAKGKSDAEETASAVEMPEEEEEDEE